MYLIILSLKKQKWRKLQGEKDKYIQIGEM